jgi:hypothetical protein
MRAARADPAPWRPSHRLPRPSSTSSTHGGRPAMAEAGRACSSGAWAWPPRALIRRRGQVDDAAGRRSRGDVGRHPWVASIAPGPRPVPDLGRLRRSVRRDGCPAQSGFARHAMRPEMSSLLVSCAFADGRGPAVAIETSQNERRTRRECRCGPGTKSMIKLMIVDDHQLVRAGLRSILETPPRSRRRRRGAERRGGAGTGAEVARRRGADGHQHAGRHGRHRGDPARTAHSAKGARRRPVRAE